MSKPKIAEKERLGVRELIAMGVGGTQQPRTDRGFSGMTWLIVSLAVSIANFGLRSQTGSQPVLFETGAALILATVVIMCVWFWRQASADLAWTS